jgi:MFS family permease
MAYTQTGNGGPTEIHPGASKMLLLLLAINLFNYIDRQILSATLSNIQLDLFNPNDPWLNRKLGSLTSAFLVVYMLTAPLFGVLGDKFSRWYLVGIGVIAWSLASGASGLAGAYIVLLLTRCFVGVGEAAYGPVAPSMLSDMYPVSHRGKVLSWFYLAIPVGSALGFVLGGAIAGSFGWRAAFYAVTFPGLILGLFCFFMKEPPRYKGPESAQKDTYWERVKKIWRIRSFRFCTLGMTCTTFVLGGVAAFAPKYIFERVGQLQITDKSIEKLVQLKAPSGEPLIPVDVIEQLNKLRSEEPLGIPQMNQLLKEKLTRTAFENYYPQIVSGAQAYKIVDGQEVPLSLSLSQINLYFGVLVVVCGLLATLLGGILGDYLRKYMQGAYFLVCGYSAMLAFPLFVGMVLVPFPYAWLLLAGAVFFLFFNTGPANAITANVTHSGVRATGFALNILIIHLFGDAISPFIMGWIADVWSWEIAMLAVSTLIFVAGAIWILGASGLEQDTTAAESLQFEDHSAKNE